MQFKKSIYVQVGDSNSDWFLCWCCGSLGKLFTVHLPFFKIIFFWEIPLYLSTFALGSPKFVKFDIWLEPVAALGVKIIS